MRTTDVKVVRWKDNKPQRIKVAVNGDIFSLNNKQALSLAAKIYRYQQGSFKHSSEDLPLSTR